MTETVTHRILSGTGASGSTPRWETGNTTGRGQDKRAHIALGSVVCFCRDFWRAPHLAALGDNVRRTRKPLQFQGLSYLVGPRHGR